MPAGLLLLLCLGACSAPGDEAPAVVALEFARTVASSPATACDLLSDDVRESLEEQAETDCVAALPDSGLPRGDQVVAVVVAGGSAQVRLRNDTYFLARSDTGWRVVAAGCTRVSDDAAVPYQCVLEG